MEFRLNDLQSDYSNLCQTIVKFGQDHAPRDIHTREMTGVTLLLENPYVVTLPIGVNRRVNVRLAAIETLGVLGGVWPHDLVMKAAPEYGAVLVTQSREHADSVAYGPRIRSQLFDVVEQLKQSPASRQAVVVIWQLHDLDTLGDKPCTLSLQFLLREGLECHVTMRSQDVWLGLAMDVFMFTQLQLTLARMLHVKAGKYVHHVGSLHAYERDWMRIRDLGRTAVEPKYFPRGLQDLGFARKLLASTTASMNNDQDVEWYNDKLQQVRQEVSV